MSIYNKNGLLHSESDVQKWFDKAIGIEINKKLDEVNKDQNATLISNGSPVVTIMGNTLTSPFNYINPPINFDTWVLAPFQSSRLRKCIDIFSRVTVGLGVEVVSTLEINKDTPIEIVNKIEQEKETLNNFLKTANKKEPISEIFYKMKLDEETLGNGYIEVTRNGLGGVDGLYYAPALNMRILHDGRGFIQLNRTYSNKIDVFFKPLGITLEEVKSKFLGATSTVMNKYTGRYVGEYYNGEGSEREQPPKIEDRATELLHFWIPTPIDSFYGIPKHYAASLAISGNRLAARRNVNFFSNDAVGRIAIIVENGVLHPESRKNLENMFSQGKGVEEAHKALIIEADTASIGDIGDGSKKRVSIELKPLTVGVNEDANFLKYQENNNDEIRETYGLPQIYFKSEDINKASSQVSKKITDEQEFEPDRLRKEFVLNHILIKQDPLNIEYVKIIFKRPDAVDPVEKSNYLNSLSKNGAITPNEIRKEIGKAPFTKDFIFGDKPLPISLLELQMSVSPATMNNPQFENPVIQNLGIDPYANLDSKSPDNNSDPQTEDTAKENNEHVILKNIYEKNKKNKVTIDSLVNIINTQSEVIKNNNNIMLELLNFMKSNK